MNERQIFEGAIEFPNAVDRAAFLERACGGDVALRTSVEALLAAHDAKSQFLNVPAVEQLQGGTDKRLDRTLDHSVTQPNDEIDIDEASDGPDLSFLQPSTKPGSIGSLGHYEILQVLGQGAFGVVFRAFDEKLHRQVAVKAMNPQLAATSPPRKRFLREARSVAAIKHENIVQIYSVEEQPLPYLVMEFVQGQTLQQKLDGNGPLEVPELLHLGRQMAAGLAAAHALSMVHRDIKPGNILLEQGAEQKVKITDFGLARAADDASMTRTGVIAGTPLYMSPEQAEGRTLDARSDLFSLGSVLYQMATGRPPFRAPNTIAVLRRVVEDTPRPMTEIIADLPPWLEFIVQKLLAKDPAQRFQSAKEVADLVARCQTELQLHGKVTCVTAATSQAADLPQKSAATVIAAKSQPGQNRWLVAAPAILVAFLLGMYLINRAVDRFYPATPANPPNGNPTQVSNAPALHKFPSGEWIDVIPLIEPQKDKWNVAKQTGKNAWRVEQGELIVGGDALSSKLVLPLDSDWPAYECEFDFTRRGGENGLNVNLPTSNGECPVVFDPPGFACIHLGNQQRGAKLQVGKQILTDQRTTVRVEVHRAPSNNDRVSVSLNGAQPWDWTGDLNALALTYRENFPQDRRITLWIHRGGDYVFHRIRVRTLDGGVASSLRPVPPVVPANPAIPAAAAGGFLPVFNGKDLTGWTVASGGVGHWKVVDNSITCSESFDHLYTQRDDFRDFHLRAELKVNESGNSGIYFRAGKPVEIIGDYEAQICNRSDQLKTGSLFGLVKVENVLVPPDTWFNLEIIAQGKRIQIFVNGKRTADFEETRPNRRAAGHIAVQYYGHETKVYFRKLEIKELRADEEVSSLFATPAGN